MFAAGYINTQSFFYFLLFLSYFYFNYFSFSFPSYGDNSKAAVIRIGLKEMIQFAKRFYEDVELETFFESCGVADLITTCYGGRNRIAGEEFVKGKVS